MKSAAANSPMRMNQATVVPRNQPCTPDDSRNTPITAVTPARMISRVVPSIRMALL